MSNFNDKLNELLRTTDSTAEFDAQDIESNKAMGILAYLSWLVLIPLLAAKQSKFARFHCNQGLVLAIAGTVICFVLGILTIIPYVGWIFTILESIAGLAFFVMAILGIVNAANGKAKDLPIIGKIRILK